MSEETGIFGEAPDTDPTLALEAEYAAEDAGEIVPDAPDGAAEPPAGEQPAEQQQQDGASERRLSDASLQQKVPLTELLNVRKELAAEREKWARLDERFRLAQQMEERRKAEEQAKQQAQQDPPPDPNEDPDGYREWQLREIQRRQDAFDAQQRQIAEQQQHIVAHQQQQQRWAQFSDQVLSFEGRAKASAETADYEHAVNYVGAYLRAPLERAGMPEQVIQQQIHNLRMQFLDSCVRVHPQPDGSLAWEWVKDPAVELYKLARELGYQGAAPAAAQVANGNGAQPQIQQQGAVPEPRQQQATPRQVQMRQAGVAAAQRQGAGGQPADADGPLTLDRVINMSLAEFAYWQERDPEALKRAMGG